MPVGLVALDGSRELVPFGHHLLQPLAQDGELSILALDLLPRALLCLQVRRVHLRTAGRMFRLGALPVVLVFLEGRLKTCPLGDGLGEPGLQIADNVLRRAILLQDGQPPFLSERLLQPCDVGGVVRFELLLLRGLLLDRCRQRLTFRERLRQLTLQLGKFPILTLTLLLRMLLQVRERHFQLRAIGCMLCLGALPAVLVFLKGRLKACPLGDGLGKPGLQILDRILCLAMALHNGELALVSERLLEPGDVRRRDRHRAAAAPRPAARPLSPTPARSASACVS